jgi:uncharacterized UPF0146 family protein
LPEVRLGLEADGSSASQRDFLKDSHRFQGITEQDKAPLERFLLSFPTETPPIVGFTRTIHISNRNEQSIQSDVALLIEQAQLGDCSLSVTGLLRGERIELVYDPASDLFRDRLSGNEQLGLERIMLRIDNRVGCAKARSRTVADLVSISVKSFLPVVVFEYPNTILLLSIRHTRQEAAMDRTQHWENVYQTKSSTEVSWYEPDPKQSLDLILRANGVGPGRVLDVGVGQSFLVDRLLDAGIEQVAVLDISKTAIEATKARLGQRASQVKWIVADITNPDSLGEFDVWHDRAVFHFITDPEDRGHYVNLLKRSLPIGGHFIVGTFAKGGPEKCSGLPICQYDAATMQAELGPSFEPVECSEYLHTTPTGKPQQFFFGVYKRIA